MPERPRPDLDRVREALHDHDDREEEQEVPRPGEQHELTTPEEDDGEA